MPKSLARRAIERHHAALNANESWAHLFTFTPFTSTPAHSSTVLTMVVKSASAPWRSAVMASNSRITLPQIMGTPSPAASSVHNFTSFSNKPMAKPKSNVRGRIALGNLSVVAVLRPVREQAAEWEELGVDTLIAGVGAVPFHVTSRDDVEMLGHALTGVGRQD